MSGSRATPVPTMPLHKLLKRKECTPNSTYVTVCSDFTDLYTTIYICGTSFQEYEFLAFIYMHRQAPHDA